MKYTSVIISNDNCAEKKMEFFYLLLCTCLVIEIQFISIQSKIDMNGKIKIFAQKLLLLYL